MKVDKMTFFFRMMGITEMRKVKKQRIYRIRTSNAIRFIEGGII